MASKKNSVSAADKIKKKQEELEEKKRQQAAKEAEKAAQKAAQKAASAASKVSSTTGKTGTGTTTTAKPSTSSSNFTQAKKSTQKKAQVPVPELGAGTSVSETNATSAPKNTTAAQKKANSFVSRSEVAKTQTPKTTQKQTTNRGSFGTGSMVAREATGRRNYLDVLEQDSERTTSGSPNVLNARREEQLRYQYPANMKWLEEYTKERNAVDPFVNQNQNQPGAGLRSAYIDQRRKEELAAAKRENDQAIIDEYESIPNYDFLSTYRNPLARRQAERKQELEPEYRKLKNAQTIEQLHDLGFSDDDIHAALDQTAYNNLEMADRLWNAAQENGINISDIASAFDEYNRELTARRAAENPGWESAGSIITNPIESLSGVAGNVANYLNGRPISPKYSYTDTVRETVGNNIDSKLGRAAYDLSMSGADMLTSMALAGLTGGGSAVAGGLQGLEKADRVIRDSVGRGLSRDQVMAEGVLSGVSTALTEKLPLDTLSNLAKGAYAPLKALLWQGIAEGGQEVAEGALDTAIDMLVAGNNSSVALRYNDLLRNGYNTGEAIAQIAKDLGSQGFADFAGGAILGGGMGAVGNLMFHNNPIPSLEDTTNVPPTSPETTLNPATMAQQNENAVADAIRQRAEIVQNIEALNNQIQEQTAPVQTQTTQPNVNRNSVSYPALTNDPEFYFTASDEEVGRVDGIVNQREAELTSTIEDPSFRAMQITPNGSGLTYIVSRSTRDGVNYQLSTVDSNGEPLSHGDFDNAEDVAKEIAEISVTQDVDIDLLSGNNQIEELTEQPTTEQTASPLTDEQMLEELYDRQDREAEEREYEAHNYDNLFEEPLSDPRYAGLKEQDNSRQKSIGNGMKYGADQRSVISACSKLGPEADAYRKTAFAEIAQYLQDGNEDHLENALMLAEEIDSWFPAGVETRTRMSGKRGMGRKQITYQKILGTQDIAGKMSKIISEARNVRYQNTVGANLPENVSTAIENIKNFRMSADTNKSASSRSDSFLTNVSYILSDLYEGLAPSSEQYSDMTETASNILQAALDEENTARTYGTVESIPEDKTVGYVRSNLATILDYVWKAASDFDTRVQSGEITPKERRTYAKQTDTPLSQEDLTGHYLSEEEENALAEDYAEREAEEDAYAELDADGHTPEQRRVIEEYAKATDPDVKQWIDRKRNDLPAKPYRVAGSVPDVVAEIVKNDLGIDISGNTVGFDSNGLNHITNEHMNPGNGKHQITDEDLAKIGYVIEHPDDIATRDKDGNVNYSDNYKLNDNTPAPKIVIRKRIDGQYYVVEAVTDAKNHRNIVVSAFVCPVGTENQGYKEMFKGAYHVTNAADSSAPSSNVQDAHENSSSNANISLEDESVNTDQQTNTGSGRTLVEDTGLRPESITGKVPLDGEGSNQNVPQDTAQNEKVSEVRTNKPGSLMSEENEQHFPIVNFTYESKSEEESIAQAEKLYYGGGDKAINDLVKRAMKINERNNQEQLQQFEIDALMMAYIDAYNQANESHTEEDWAKANQILRAVQRQTTRSAQALQAMAKWKRNTIDGQIEDAMDRARRNAEKNHGKNVVDNAEDAVDEIFDATETVLSPDNAVDPAAKTKESIPDLLPDNSNELAGSEEETADRKLKSALKKLFSKDGKEIIEDGEYKWKLVYNEILNSKDGTRDSIIDIITKYGGIPDDVAFVIKDNTALWNEVRSKLDQASQETDDYKRRELIAEAAKSINEKMPKANGVVGFVNGLRQILYNNMLGNFRTLISRNAGGNLGFNVAEQARQPLAASIDRAVSKLTNTRTTTGWSKKKQGAYVKGFATGLVEELKDLKNSFASYKDGGKTGMHTGRRGEYDLSEAMGRNNSAFAGNNPLTKALNISDDLVKHGLSVGDRIFFEAQKAQTKEELTELIQRGYQLEGISEEDIAANGKALEDYIEAASTAIALQVVYQNDSDMSKHFADFAGSIGNLSRDIIGVDLVTMAQTPFVRTPSNVLDITLQYSPVGFVRNAIKTAKEVKQSNFNQRRFVDETSRNIVGTALLAIGVGLAKAGLTTGDYSDDEKEKADQKSHGFQPFSLHFGDDYYDVGYMPVIGQAVEAGSSFHHTFEKALDDGKSPIAALLSGLKGAGEQTAQSVFDQSVASGIMDLFSSGYGDKSFLGNIASTVARSYAGQLIPSLFRQFSAISDPYQRELGKYGTTEYTLNYMKQGIPVLRQTLPIKYDAEGNPVLQNYGEPLSEKIWDNLFRAGKHSTEQYTELEQQLQGLSESVEDSDISLPMADKADLAKVGITSSAKNISAYQEKYGKLNAEFANTFIDSTGYNLLSDGDKIKTLESLFGFSKALAKSELVNSLGEGSYDISTSNEYTKAYSIYTDKGTEGVSNWYAIKNLKGSADSNAAQIEAVDSFDDMSDADKGYYVGKMKGSQISASAEYAAEKLGDAGYYYWYSVTANRESTKKEDTLNAIENSGFSQEVKDVLYDAAGIKKGSTTDPATSSVDSTSEAPKYDTSKVFSDYGYVAPGGAAELKNAGYSDKERGQILFDNQKKPGKAVQRAKDKDGYAGVAAYYDLYDAADQAGDGNGKVKKQELIDYLQSENESVDEINDWMDIFGWNHISDSGTRSIPMLKEEEEEEDDFSQAVLGQPVTNVVPIPQLYRTPVGRQKRVTENGTGVSLRGATGLGMPVDTGDPDTTSFYSKRDEMARPASIIADELLDRAVSHGLHNLQLSDVIRDTADMRLYIQEIGYDDSRFSDDDIRMMRRAIMDYLKYATSYM